MSDAMTLVPLSPSSAAEPMPGEVPGAFALLSALRQQIIASAAPLPREPLRTRTWRGVGFEFGGFRFVSRLGEASELLVMPRMTVVPGVKPWVLGVANMRGRLLPIFDLPLFFGLTTTELRRRWRVLVVEDRESIYGLAVEQSFGIEQFSQEADDQPISPGWGAPEALCQFVEGAFQQGGKQWLVLDLPGLIRADAFQSVAA